MKTNDIRNQSISGFSKAKSACVASCKKLLGQIQHARAAIAKEFREKFGASESLLQLAMNEAEALAFQTDYPYLVFPALATEKAQAITSWQARQWRIQHRPFLAFAA